MSKIVTIIAVLWGLECAAFDPHLCQNVTLTARPIPEFTAEEKVFLCGDPAVHEWRNLPLKQVEFHARSFLQSRGYHSPIFSTRSDHLTIDPGLVTSVSEINVEQSPIPVSLHRLRNIIGQPLTPGILEIVESEIKGRMQANGYACPMIRVTGNPKNGAIVTAVDAGPIASFGEIDHDEIPGVNSTVIARYYPFEANDPFDSRKLDLAQVRTSLSSIVFSNSFLLGCEETRQAKIRHHLIVGGPNLVRFAVGANTEFGPIARAEWGNSRVGNNASQFNISGRISLRDQKLVTWANVYFDPHTRWHLAPEFGLQRFDEERNASFQITNHVGAKGSMDRGDFRYTLFIGPGTTFIQRLKGVGLDQSFTSSLNVSLEALSHPLELGRANPTQGTLLLFQNKNSLDGLLSSVNAFTFDLSGIHFLNLLDLEPPLVVLSFRFRATTTLTDQNHNSPLSLPLNYRNYLGGAKDIRGFGRNEIPASPAGALTLLTWGTEARVDIPGISQLYLLGFWDFGYLGTQMSSLDRTLYTSPGFGLYWVSPIGVLKGTLAHGVVFHDTPETQVPTHWQFYVSFGGDI